MDGLGPERDDQIVRIREVGDKERKMVRDS